MAVNLPPGWQNACLKDLLKPGGAPVEIVRGEMYRELGIRSHGKGIFHKEPISGAEVGEKRVFSVEPGCLVFNIVFAWEGAVALTGAAEVGLIASHRFPMFKPIDPSRVDTHFLWRFFQTKAGVEQLGIASPGGAGRNRTLSKKGLSEIRVPLPPLREQQKITALLGAADRAIETGRAVVEQLKKVRQELATELLTKGMPGWHKSYQKSPLGSVPAGWRSGRLEQFGLVDGGKAKDSRSAAPLRPYLRVANVMDGYVDTSDVQEMPFYDQEFQRYTILPGDILLNEGQSLELVGRCSMYRGEVGRPCAMQNALLRFRASTGEDSQFFEHYLRWCHHSGRFAKIANQTTSIAHLGLKRFANLQVAIPPSAEQKAITQILSGADARIYKEERQLEVRSHLRASLLTGLLSGQVRV